MSVIDIAEKWIDRPYLINGKKIEQELLVISSSFIQEIMKDLGKNISNSIEQQIKEGKEVKKEEVILGDCIYFGNGEGIKCVGLYIGNNKMIYPSLYKVIEQNFDYHNIKTIRRFLEKYKSGQHILNIRTAMKYNDKSCKFLLGDFNGNKIMDLFCIKNGDKTNIHILNGKDNFQSFLLQVESALHKYDNEFEFKIGNYENGKPDIYCIKKNNTGSKTTEIHILNGKDNYQSFLYQTTTALPETNDDWTFEVGEYNNNGKFNIYCIHKYNTKSKYIEIQILDGNNNYQSFLEPKIIKTSLPETKDNIEFLLRDYNKDGNLDLYCINKNGENNSTEVNILSGASNFKEFLFKDNLILNKTDDNYQFCAGIYGGYECLFEIKKNEILEIHISVI